MTQSHYFYLNWPFISCVHSTLKHQIQPYFVKELSVQPMHVEEVIKSMENILTSFIITIRITKCSQTFRKVTC